MVVLAWRWRLLQRGFFPCPLVLNFKLRFGPALRPGVPGARALGSSELAARGRRKRSPSSRFVTALHNGDWQTFAQQIARRAFRGKYATASARRR